MGTKTIKSPATGPAGPISTSGLLKQYGCGQVRFSGSDNGLYERHLLFDNIVDKALTKEGYGQAGESLRINIYPFFFEEWVLDLMKMAALPNQAADMDKNGHPHAGLPWIGEDHHGE